MLAISLGLGHRLFRGHAAPGLISSAFTAAIRLKSNKMALPRVYFDLTADGVPQGRLVIEVCANLTSFLVELFFW